MARRSCSRSPRPQVLAHVDTTGFSDGGTEGVNSGRSPTPCPGLPHLRQLMPLPRAGCPASRAPAASGRGTVTTLRSAGGRRPSSQAARTAPPLRTWSSRRWRTSPRTGVRRSVPSASTMTMPSRSSPVDRPGPESRRKRPPLLSRPPPAQAPEQAPRDTSPVAVGAICPTGTWTGNARHGCGRHTRAVSAAAGRVHEVPWWSASVVQ